MDMVKLKNNREITLIASAQLFCSLHFLLYLETSCISNDCLYDVCRLSGNSITTSCPVCLLAKHKSTIRLCVSSLITSLPGASQPFSKPDTPHAAIPLHNSTGNIKFILFRLDVGPPSQMVAQLELCQCVIMILLLYSSIFIM